MDVQPHRACELTKSNKNKKKEVTSHSDWPRVLLFDLSDTQCMVQLKDGFTAWRQSKKDDF